MSTELDKLKQAFAAEGQPRPREESRAAAIALAMQAFEKENSATAQGSAKPDRLTNIGTRMFNFLFRRRPMDATYPNLRPYLLGGASLAVKVNSSTNFIGVSRCRVSTCSPADGLKHGLISCITRSDRGLACLL